MRVHRIRIAVAVPLGAIVLLQGARTKSEALTWRRAPAPPASDARAMKLAERYGMVPLSFEANEGQTDRQVQFLSKGSGYSLFLTGTEAVMALRAPSEAESSRSAAPRAHRHVTSPSNRGAVLRMQLLGSNPATRSTGLDKLPGKSNYFIGNDSKQWRTNVSNYGKVRFDGVYPGVDLVYYGNQQQLEYHFVVAAGADPSAITLGFAGAERLQIDSQGELTLQTRTGDVRWHKPVVYQEINGLRQMVDGHYVRQGKNAVGFAVASYDRNHTLIIDPVLVYSTYIGGSQDDIATAIAVDSLGNAYLTGYTTSQNFPTVNSLPLTFGGNEDVFVTKFNAAGSAGVVLNLTLVATALRMGLESLSIPPATPT